VLFWRAVPAELAAAVATLAAQKRHTRVSPATGPRHELVDENCSRKVASP